MTISPDTWILVEREKVTAAVRIDFYHQERFLICQDINMRYPNVKNGILILALYPDQPNIIKIKIIHSF